MRMRKRIFALIASSALAAAMSHSFAEQPKKIGVSMAYFDDVWLTNVRNNIAETAKVNGVTVHFEDANGDINKQLSQIQNFIANRDDAIIVVPVEPRPRDL